LDETTPPAPIKAKYSVNFSYYFSDACKQQNLVHSNNEHMVRLLQIKKIILSLEGEMNVIVTQIN
jgi:predicted phage-related endonuclease